MFVNKTFFSMLFLISVFTGIFAQSEDQPNDLVTDRPDQTESSIAVPHKSFQIETGFSMSVGNYTDRWEGSVGYGETLLRYGLFDGMELRLAMDYSTMMTEYSFGGPIIETKKGFSPVALGTKINLTEQRGWIPEMALIMHVVVPVFSSDFTLNYAVPDLILAASHKISQRFSLGYNLGMEWADEDSSPTKKYSAVAGFGLSDRIGMYLETFGSFSQGEFMSMIDGGFTFLMLPNLQFDISGGLGITASSPDFFVSTGLSYRLPQ